MPETSERSTVEILRAARERIGDPEHWTQSAYAVDASGSAVDVTDPEAVSWCVRGAVLVESGFKWQVDLKPFSPGDRANKLLEVACPPGQIVLNVNDYGSHADVLDLCDGAIQLAEAEATR